MTDPAPDQLAALSDQETASWWSVTAGLAMAGTLGALAAGVAAAATGFEPRIAAPMATAGVIAVVVAIRPASGIAAFLILVLLGPTLQSWLRIDLQFLDEFFVALVVVIAAILSRSRIARLRPGWQGAALALAIGAGVVSSLANQVPAEIWVPALVLLIKGIAFYYAVSWLQIDIPDVERVGTVMLAVALTVFALGLVEAVNPSSFQEALGLPPFQEVRGGLSSLKSVFLHPSIFGWFMTFAALFLYARFIVLRERWSLAVGLVLSIGALLSGRRRAAIGILAAFAVGIAWIWRRGLPRGAIVRVLAPVSVAIVLAGVLTLPALSDFYAGTFNEYLGSGDLTEILRPDPDPDAVAGAQPRMALYVGSVAIARDYFPLGAGLGRFGSYMSEAHYSPMYQRYGLTAVYGLGRDNPLAITDTFWPMILGELGPLGLVGVGGFLGILGLRLWRVAAGATSTTLQALALGAVFVFAESLIGSMTASTYVSAPIAYWVFAAAGVVAFRAPGMAGRLELAVDDSPTNREGHG